MDINYNGKHKNKPVTRPKTATPLYAARRRRVVMLAIAIFALLPGAAFADTLCEDGWLSPSNGGSGTCSWHGGIAGGDDYNDGYNDGYDDGDGYYGSGNSSQNNGGAVLFWVVLVGGAIYWYSNSGFSKPKSGSRNTTPKQTELERVMFEPEAIRVNHSYWGKPVRGVYADGSTVYAATDHGLSISTDGGVTFKNRTTEDGLGDNFINGVYADGSTVYAATDHGLSISTDGGVTFKNRTFYTFTFEQSVCISSSKSGLGDNWVQEVYADGSTVYAATKGGLSISTDGGVTFKNRTTEDGLGDNSVREVYADGSTVYAATKGGLSISTDGGVTFKNRTTKDGIGDNSVWGVYADGSTVYAATWVGLSISTDGGATFKNRTRADGLRGNYVYGVYADGSTVYAATYGGLSISTDGGATFSNRTTRKLPS